MFAYSLDFIGFAINRYRLPLVLRAVAMQRLEDLAMIAHPAFSKMTWCLSSSVKRATERSEAASSGTYRALGMMAGTVPLGSIHEIAQ